MCYARQSHSSSVIRLSRLSFDAFLSQHIPRIQNCKKASRLYQCLLQMTSFYENITHMYWMCQTLIRYNHTQPKSFVCMKGAYKITRTDRLQNIER